MSTVFPAAMAGVGTTLIVFRVTVWCCIFRFQELRPRRCEPGARAALPCRLACGNRRPGISRAVMKFAKCHGKRHISQIKVNNLAVGFIMSA